MLINELLLDKFSANGLTKWHWALAQHGLRTFIHSKTGYQPAQAKHHDNSLELSIEEQLKKKVEELELKVVEQAEKIRKMEYQPIYEKTYQSHLYAQWGGTREFHVGSSPASYGKTSRFSIDD